MAVTMVIKHHLHAPTHPAVEFVIIQLESL